jgi:hypothetical protein
MGSAPQNQSSASQTYDIIPDPNEELFSLDDIMAQLFNDNPITSPNLGPEFAWFSQPETDIESFEISSQGIEDASQVEREILDVGISHLPLFSPNQSTGSPGSEGGNVCPKRYYSPHRNGLVG